MALFGKKKEKDSKKVLVKENKKKKRHCTRCSKDVDKLYSWRGFHFCINCKRELNSTKASK